MLKRKKGSAGTVREQILIGGDLYVEDLYDKFQKQEVSVESEGYFFVFVDLHKISPMCRSRVTKPVLVYCV